jgi:hypothetical protein
MNEYFLALSQILWTKGNYQNTDFEALRQKANDAGESGLLLAAMREMAMILKPEGVNP